MTFPVVAAIAMLEGFQLMGLDADAIREHAAITRVDLADETARLSDEQFSRMWKSAIRISRCESLAIEVARRLPLGSFGIFDYLVASAATVGEALDTLCRHFGLVADGMVLEIDRRSTRRIWVRIHNEVSFDGRDVSDEFTLAALLTRLQPLTLEPVRAIEVRLSRAPVTDPEHWNHIWGARVRFGSAISGICLAEDACAIPLRTADSRLERVLRGLARDAATHPPSFVLAARTTLRQALRTSRPTEARLARELKMSIRSLQRRLREAGTSYRLLLDDVRREEGLRLLESASLPLGQIAHTLGFREQASFTRAFRRWTGQSPREWLRASRSES